MANKKVSVAKNKSKDAKNKKKDENADKSERSSSPAFESDEDSSGNGNEKPQVQTLVVPLAKKRPSIAGLLVSVGIYYSIKINHLHPLNKLIVKYIN